MGGAQQRTASSGEVGRRRREEVEVAVSGGDGGRRVCGVAWLGLRREGREMGGGGGGQAGSVRDSPQ